MQAVLDALAQEEAELLGADDAEALPPEARQRVREHIHRLSDTARSLLARVSELEAESHMLASLPPREAQVLKMRFGIGERSKHTLEEVGNDFDVTRERIRQIEAKALRKLRHPSRSSALRSFLD